MITDNNSIGVVHWGGMFAGTDGEQITLVIPAFFRFHHVPFLEGVLVSRLDDFFGEEVVSFRLEAGELERSNTGRRYEPGRIIITGVREPWPDGEKFRKTLDDAFVEAGEVESEQVRRAQDLVRHLRTTGDRPSDHSA
jgi:hypothetical protein